MIRENIWLRLFFKKRNFLNKVWYIFSWFSIWFNSSSNFELLNFIWWLYDDAADDMGDDVGDDAADDAGNEFVNLFISYEELFKLYAELFDVDVELSLNLRDLEELVLLNFLIILLIVIENNYNIVLDQFK